MYASMYIGMTGFCWVSFCHILYTEAQTQVKAQAQTQVQAQAQAQHSTQLCTVQ